jgi:hypothetical protein
VTGKGTVPSGRVNPRAVQLNRKGELPTIGDPTRVTLLRVYPSLSHQPFRRTRSAWGVPSPMGDPPEVSASGVGHPPEVHEGTSPRVTPRNPPTGWTPPEVTPWGYISDPTWVTTCHRASDNNARRAWRKVRPSSTPIERANEPRTE